MKKKPVPTKSHTNRAVQPHKMARGLKFRTWEEEGFFFLRSENKDAEQFRGDRETALRLCFRTGKKNVFLTPRLKYLRFAFGKTQIQFICATAQTYQRISFSLSK